MHRTGILTVRQRFLCIKRGFQQVKSGFERVSDVSNGDSAGKIWVWARCRCSKRGHRCIKRVCRCIKLRSRLEVRNQTLGRRRPHLPASAMRIVLPDTRLARRRQSTKPTPPWRRRPRTSKPPPHRSIRPPQHSTLTRQKPPAEQTTFPIFLLFEPH